jgi:hypothetical protein
MIGLRPGQGRAANTTRRHIADVVTDTDAARERRRVARERQQRADFAAEVHSEGRTFKPRRQTGRE